MKNKIHINQLGYSLYGTKKAVCTGTGLSGDSFSLIDAYSDKTMMTGKLSDIVFDEASGDMTASADFTSFSKLGNYYLKVGRRRSFTFPISERPYSELKNTILKSFYHNRCGTVNKNYSGEYYHPSCHTAPAALIEDKSKFVNVSGGWHDSGSYGKYVTTACTALGHMLYAYKLFPAAFREKNNIPNAPQNMPDILAECRTELKWLMKMQADDGGVYHKVCTLRHSAYVTPENDTDPQYVSPRSWQATTLFVAVAALAAGIYERFDKDFADLLSASAFSGWIWLTNNTEYREFVNPTEIMPVSDADMPPKNPDESMFWTVCELYELTGEEVFRDKIAELYRSVEVTSFLYDTPGGFGALAYMTGTKPKDIEIERSIHLKFRIEADNLVMNSEKSGYASTKSTDNYTIFTNVQLLDSAITLIFADMILKCGDYIRTAEEQFNYVLGKNPLGKCFVTGMGANPVRNPHHRMSAFSETDNPVPGMAVAGVCAAEDKKDDYARWNIPKGTPPAKCYCDNNFSYSTNEPLICCSSALLFAAACFDLK